MDLEVLRAAGIGRDLALIFDFLVAAAEDFGENAETAFDMAERLVDIEAAMLDFGRVPHQGTLRAELGDGMRNVTEGRLVFYFVVNDGAETLRLLVVFFGGQDHRARVLLRFLTGH